MSAPLRSSWHQCTIGLPGRRSQKLRLRNDKLLQVDIICEGHLPPWLQCSNRAANLSPICKQSKAASKQLLRARRVDLEDTSLGLFVRQRKLYLSIYSASAAHTIRMQIAQRTLTLCWPGRIMAGSRDSILLVAMITCGQLAHALSGRAPDQFHPNQP